MALDTACTTQYPTNVYLQHRRRAHHEPETFGSRIGRRRGCTEGGGERPAVLGERVERQTCPCLVARPFERRSLMKPSIIRRRTPTTSASSSSLDCDVCGIESNLPGRGGLLRNR